MNHSNFTFEEVKNEIQRWILICEERYGVKVDVDFNGDSYVIDHRDWEFEPFVLQPVYNNYYDKWLYLLFEDGERRMIYKHCYNPVEISIRKISNYIN